MELAGGVELLIGGLGLERARFPVKLRSHQLRRYREPAWLGVSLSRKRETAQTEVKVPKCGLSVLKVVPNPRQRGGRLRSSHPLKSA